MVVSQQGNPERSPAGPPDGVEPLVSRSRVRFSDIDGMGHVNNAVYLSYMEEARFDWVLGEVGMDDLQQVDFVLAHVTIDYLSPARLGDVVRVEMWVPRIGKKSWDFQYRLCDESGDTVYATARTTQVAYDYASARTKPLPEHFRSRLRPLHAAG